MAAGSIDLEVVQTVEGIREAVARARGSSAGLRVGFVPTMGALHAGHARLIERCREVADRVVVSIFVNPTQFGPTEDLAKYPRTLDRDLEVAQRAGASVVFTPTDEIIYPRGKAATFVEVPGISHVLEGAVRPTHFRGVATVVLALFEIVRPDLAVFGQKDFQQQLLIRRMVGDLHVPVEIVTEPTVREADGLAMSSRNRYLSPEERAAATVLHRALEAARAAVRGGEREAGRVRQILDRTISLERLASLDYAEVADADSLEPLVSIDASRRAVALVAARVGTTRLIDNALLAE
ncbi:pantoate--beta-alanine ligase [Aquisphaera insulae]|uniref:pantoate--beta-alanine ligase n=1 Tax=Aquisphaera insulae TaxID=2712864 RepID=UPI0013E9E980|nr:pantoate--beta-alanine ligase [Aquisphaera insulae]